MICREVVSLPKQLDVTVVLKKIRMFIPQCWSIFTPRPVFYNMSEKKEQQLSNTDMPIVSHAGGVVFRPSTKGLEYLLVRARKPPDAWVFPKGHIEEGESPDRAAIREVLEEAGVRVAIVSSLGVLPVGAQYAEMFLMAYDSVGGSPPEREYVWLEFNAAREKLTFEESRHLLIRADHIARKLP